MTGEATIDARPPLPPPDAPPEKPDEVSAAVLKGLVHIRALKTLVANGDLVKTFSTLSDQKEALETIDEGTVQGTYTQYLTEYKTHSEVLRKQKNAETTLSPGDFIKHFVDDTARKEAYYRVLAQLDFAREASSAFVKEYFLRYRMPQIIEGIHQEMRARYRNVPEEVDSYVNEIQPHVVDFVCQARDFIALSEMKLATFEAINPDTIGESARLLVEGQSAILTKTRYVDMGDVPKYAGQMGTDTEKTFVMRYVVARLLGSDQPEALGALKVRFPGKKLFDPYSEEYYSHTEREGAVPQRGAKIHIGFSLDNPRLFELITFLTTTLKGKAPFKIAKFFNTNLDFHAKCFTIYPPFDEGVLDPQAVRTNFNQAAVLAKMLDDALVEMGPTKDAPTPFPSDYSVGASNFVSIRYGGLTEKPDEGTAGYPDGWEDNRERKPPDNFPSEADKEAFLAVAQKQGLKIIQE